MPTPTAEMKLRRLAERTERVFASYPLVARYFPATAIEDARQRLARSIDRGDGPGLVIGAPGSGKSLLLQVIATQYHERFDVVLLAAARFCTRRALLQAILFELGLPYKLRDEGDLRLSLLDHLLSNDCPTGLLLLADEAQALPVALLDELRILTNLVRAGVPRVRLVLAGSAALEEAFAHPELESLSQRLSARCYLPALNRDESSQYIRAQIAASGCSPDEVFAADAMDAVFDATDGVPRLVNQLCDRALQIAVSKSASRIDRQVIQEAWSDLQQLPTPWETPVVSEVAEDVSPVIEFGDLTDEMAQCVTIHGNSMLETDDTELDAEDDIAVFAPAVSTVQVAASVARSISDPFAEKFEEEEVVLDNFAAWDDMFSRDVPRVANRRDPGFSTLVQAAIDASPVAASNFSVDDTLMKSEPLHPTIDWPRLRLAEISDVSATDVSPFVTAAKPPGAKAHADLLTSVLTAFGADQQAANNVVDDSPMIIIDDDSVPSPPKPAVRREDYRHLFSRLRSG